MDSEHMMNCLRQMRVYREVYESQTQGGGDFDENGGEA